MASLPEARIQAIVENPGTFTNGFGKLGVKFLESMTFLFILLPFKAHKIFFLKLLMACFL